MISLANEGEHTAIIPANGTAVKIDIPTVDDQAWEAHASVTVSITEPSPVSKTFQVLDNDMPATLISITEPEPIAESTTAASRSLELTITAATDDDHEPHRSVKLGFEALTLSASNSANAPSDYTLPANTNVEFAPYDFERKAVGSDFLWEASTSIVISIVDDLIDEDTETGQVRISIPSGQPASLRVETTPTDIVIQDNEAYLSNITVTDALTEFDFSSYDAETNTYDINFANDVVETTVVATPAYGATIDSTTNPGTADIELSVGVNTHEIKIIAEDATTERLYSLNLNRQEAGLSISAQPNQVIEGGNITFTVSRGVSAGDSLSVNVEIAQSETGVVALADVGTRIVVIGATQAAANFTVSTLDNLEYNAVRTLTATIKAGTGYTVPDTDNVEVSVTDNDVPATTLSIEALSVSTETESKTFSESAGNVTIRVIAETNTDQAPNGTLQLELSASSTEATAGSDYSFATASVTFAPGDYSQVTEGGVSIYRATKQYTLTIIDDTLDEGNESVLFNVRAVVENSSLALPGIFEIDILDNEAFLQNLQIIDHSIAFESETFSYVLDVPDDISSVVVQAGTPTFEATVAPDFLSGETVDLEIGANYYRNCGDRRGRDRHYDLQRIALQMNRLERGRSSNSQISCPEQCPNSAFVCIRNNFLPSKCLRLGGCDNSSV